METYLDSLRDLRSRCERLYVEARGENMNNTSNLLNRVPGSPAQAIPEYQAEFVAQEKAAALPRPVIEPKPGE